MVSNQLLIRTIHAAKESRDRGFYNTADAFDEIVESLLSLLEPELSFQNQGITRPPSQHDQLN